VASIALSSTLANGTLPPGTGATLHELSVVSGPGVIDQAAFADRTRWRSGITAGVQLPDIVSGSAGLGIAVGAKTLWDASTLYAPGLSVRLTQPIAGLHRRWQGVGRQLGRPAGAPVPEHR